MHAIVSSPFHRCLLLLRTWRRTGALPAASLWSVLLCDFLSLPRLAAALRAPGAHRGDTTTHRHDAIGERGAHNLNTGERDERVRGARVTGAHAEPARVGPHPALAAPHLQIARATHPAHAHSSRTRHHRAASPVWESCLCSWPHVQLLLFVVVVRRRRRRRRSSDAVARSEADHRLA